MSDIEYDETLTTLLIMKDIVPYYDDLRTLIPSLGFCSSDQMFSYLRECNVKFDYARHSTTDGERIPNIIQEHIDIAIEGKYIDMGFIFVMDHIKYDYIDVIHIFSLPREKLIKCLKLKVFS